MRTDVVARLEYSHTYYPPPPVAVFVALAFIIRWRPPLKHLSNNHCGHFGHQPRRALDDYPIMKYFASKRQSETPQKLVQETARFHFDSRKVEVHRYLASLREIWLEDTPRSTS